MSLLYGVNKATLDAYVQVERLKVWEAVLGHMSMVDMNEATGTYKDKWIEEWWLLKQWLREQAAKETQP